MSIKTDNRTMDTSASEEISVRVTRDPFVSGGHLVVLEDTTIIPGHRNYLTVVEARKLAAFLIEQADIADGLNLDA